ncbi:STAS domain-containing protein [Nocardioides caldifontis]|uniref:STAS domain-containing protein n=1 Tax=Nocardioides caldifontis TaxID=2588938 RepID=UPI001396CA5B|nr:STAS domain-containing protein [Nocardioides caldifontis]
MDLPLLTVLVEIDPPALLVRLQGEIDLSCVDLLDSITGLSLEEVDRVMLDLSGLVFTDSAGADALLRLREDLLATGRIVMLVGPRRIVRTVFELLGAGHLLAA